MRGSMVVGLDNAYLDQTKNPTIFDYVQRWKAAQKYNNFAKVGSKICQTLKNPQPFDKD